jgi:hypothetical protein
MQATHPRSGDRRAAVITDRVSEWFKTREAAFVAKGEELASAHLMALPGHDPEAAARDLQDAVEIIRWYHMFICAKLARAIGMHDEDEEEEEESQSEEIQNDSNGSAKIALIAIDRSLAAWSRLRDHLPSEGDEIIDVLTQLNRLKKFAEQTFPNARLFVRPGFDEGATV